MRTPAACVVDGCERVTMHPTGRCVTHRCDSPLQAITATRSATRSSRRPARRGPRGSRRCLTEWSSMDADVRSRQRAECRPPLASAPPGHRRLLAGRRTGHRVDQAAIRWRWPTCTACSHRPRRRPPPRGVRPDRRRRAQVYTMVTEGNRMRRSLRCSLSPSSRSPPTSRRCAPPVTMCTPGAAGRSARRRNQIIRLLADGADPASLPDCSVSARDGRQRPRRPTSRRPTPDS